MVVLFCHLHINCCLPVSNDMLPMPFVRPPVNEKFISVFLKHWFSGFPYNQRFQRFFDVSSHKTTDGNWLFYHKCMVVLFVWGEPSTRKCNYIVWVELGNMSGMPLFMVCRTEVWIPPVCLCLQLLHTKVLLPTLLL